MFVEIESGRWSQPLVAQVLTRHCRVEPSRNAAEAPPPVRFAAGFAEFARAIWQVARMRPAGDFDLARSLVARDRDGRSTPQSRAIRLSAVLIEQPGVLVGNSWIDRALSVTTFVRR